MRLTSPFLAVLLLAVLASQAAAQRVRWEPAGGSLALRQTSQLSLIFEDCEPTGEFTLPAIPNLTIGQPSRGEQSSFNIINGQATRTKTVYYSYPVRPGDRQPVRIPSFTVQTDKGPIQVPAITFEVGEATVGNSSIPLDSAASSRVTVGSGQLWAGEVVPIEYVLSVANRFPASIASAPEWESQPIVMDEWSKPEPGSTLVNGESRNTMTYRSRGYIPQAGTYPLEPINQLVNLRVPSSGFSIFQAFQAEQYTITSNAPQLVIRPLPSPAPAEFHGAVGEFELKSTVVPAQATVGEPVTWTLQLSGTGNWPDLSGLPGREVSRDFRVVQPQAQRTMQEGTLFEGQLSEDVVLIPTRPGTYRLGPINWTYFDPKSGRYRTLTTEPFELTVNPAAAPAPDPHRTTATPGAAPQTQEPPAAPVVRASPAPIAPAAIPRDPLPGAGPASAPWAAKRLVWLCGALLALIPLSWLALAWQRAATADEGRHARQARRRLHLTLAQLRATSDAATRRKLLLAWQRDVIHLWGLRRIVPAASAFASDAAWAQLWAESEHALYSGQSDLPSDWVARAEQALGRKPAPRFRATSVLRARHLVPILIFAGLLLAFPLRAADAAAEAYARGDFAEAERQWREQLAGDPHSWSLHHNLALSLAQQERWAEAGAHALVAFVQQPSNPSVRWHFSYALGRAGFTPPVLGRFAAPSPVHQLAQTFSPSGWQRVLVGAAALLMLAGVVALLRWYGHAPRAFGWLSGSMGALALAMALSAGISLRQYGPAVDPRAVLIWKPVALRSVPTDVDAEQQTSTVTAGSLAVADRAFLGWRRLVFGNGQTGWVRREELLPLWSLE